MLLFRLHVGRLERLPQAGRLRAAVWRCALLLMTGRLLQCRRATDGTALQRASTQVAIVLTLLTGDDMI